MNSWDTLDENTVADYKVFSLIRRVLKNPRTGRTHPFFVMKTTDWVNIIAITPDEQVVLVKQYRAGTESVTLELPGGTIDPGETPRTAAIRELLEETGFHSDDVQAIGTVHPNPAIQSNRCHSFVAWGAQRIAAQSLDEGEAISGELVPRRAIPALIEDGTMSHALVVAAFAHLERRQSRGAG